VPKTWQRPDFPHERFGNFVSFAAATKLQLLMPQHFSDTVPD
jgi:hypothetical protein